MKLKFVAEPIQWLIFLIYVIFLFFLVAIAVANLNSFAFDAIFVGLNPTRAFYPEYFPTTLMLFILALIASYSLGFNKIIKQEEGFGIEWKKTKKEDDGYSRWFKDKEMKAADNIKRIVLKDDTLEAGGVPIINNGTEAWVDNGEYHSMIIGASGSGKTQGIVHPLVKILAKKGESMIITDPKGELYEQSYSLLKSKGYKIVLLNFRDPSHGQAWNPLSMPYKYYKEGEKDKAMELLEDLGKNIIVDKNQSDPFWQNSSAAFFAGLALGLFEDANEDEINLNSIYLMSGASEEKIGRSDYLKEYFNIKGEDSKATISAKNTVYAPDETRGGVLSTFQQKIQIFATRDNLSEMLSYSDFDLREIGKMKTAVFLKIHDEKTTYHSLMTIFIKQAYESLVDVASHSEGLKLKYRTNFILDEFANMPALADVDAMVTAARSRNIRMTFIIQNFAQLTDVYGKEAADTLRGNCPNLIYLISSELAALEEISKMCGEIKPKDADEKGKGALPSRPLITVTDLQMMKMYDALVVRFRNRPYKTKLTPDWKIDWGYKVEPAQYPNREKKEVKVFKIKKFVDEHRQQNNMMGPGLGFAGFPGFNTPMNMPSMNTALPFNPFGGSANPTSMNNPLMSSGSSLSDADIDEIVRGIDRQVEELKKKEESENNDKSADIENKVYDANIINDKLLEDDVDDISEIFSNDINKNEIENAPVVNIDTDSVIVNNNNEENEDDDFFDDFFGDD